MNSPKTNRNLKRNRGKKILEEYQWRLGEKHHKVLKMVFLSNIDAHTYTHQQIITQVDYNSKWSKCNKIGRTPSPFPPLRLPLQLPRLFVSFSEIYMKQIWTIYNNNENKEGKLKWIIFTTRKLIKSQIKKKIYLVETDPTFSNWKSAIRCSTTFHFLLFGTYR